MFVRTRICSDKNATMSKLRVAIQKSGRLSQKSVKLLHDCGISFSNGTGKLKAEAKNFPIEVLFLRDDDIPQYVEQQVADVGILGRNEVLEKNKEVREVEALGFAGCRLSLAVPRDLEYEGLHYFNGKKVATSYVNILENYFKANNIEAEIEEISGSVEIAPGIGLAHAICDIVSTGSTLLSNGLKEVETVMKSEAVLIASHSIDDERQQVLERLLFRIRAVRRSSDNKYILLNAPDESIERIADILPGMNSPTVVPLVRPGWSSIHSVIREDAFWEVIDKLRDAGAEGILIVPIEKMIL